jgi:hypothetical protein
MPQPTSEDKKTDLRRALAKGLSLPKAAEVAGVCLSTAKRLSRKNDEYGRELRVLIERNAPRRRAQNERLRALPQVERYAHEPVELVTELVDDADATGGPSMGEILDSAWATYEDKEAPDTLRRACFEAVFKFKAAPVLAEVARQGAAEQVEAVERVRVVMPEKRALSE